MTTVLSLMTKIKRPLLNTVHAALDPPLLWSAFGLLLDFLSSSPGLDGMHLGDMGAVHENEQSQCHVPRKALT